MGAGMAKFICKKVETVDEYDEYCHYVAGLVGLGLSKLFHASGLEDMAPDPVSNSMGLFLQKTNIIRDYLEDINEMPKSRMFWPHQVWRKYANKLEDLKYEEYSVKSIFCLNEKVTNALTRGRLLAVYVGTAESICLPILCYSPGLTAKIIDQTRTISDVYGAFFDFSCMLKAKELIYASVDNPSNAVEWDMAGMINQPEILHKAVKELDRVAGKERLVLESDFPQLNYIKACAREAFRLHPIVPFNLPHVSTVDATVAGYFVPKGSHVLLSRTGLGQNPKVWDEPLKFKPEHHLEDGSGNVELVEPELRFISFSTGWGGCMGARIRHDHHVVG